MDIPLNPVSLLDIKSCVVIPEGIVAELFLSFIIFSICFILYALSGLNTSISADCIKLPISFIECIDIPKLLAAVAILAPTPVPSVL